MSPDLATDGERWSDDGRTVGAGREAPQRPAYPRHEPEMKAVSVAASLEVRQVVDAVCRSIPLDRSELADEFFPAHLPVALIDAVFRSRLRPGERPAPVAERYCRRIRNHSQTSGPLGASAGRRAGDPGRPDPALRRVGRRMRSRTGSSSPAAASPARRSRGRRSSCTRRRHSETSRSTFFRTCRPGVPRRSTQRSGPCRESTGARCECS